MKSKRLKEEEDEDEKRKFLLGESWMKDP